VRVDSWLKKAANALTKASISSAQLDCLLLLEDLTGRDRAWLLAHPERELAHKDVKTLDALIKRRSNHEPLAYIRGRSEFYGHEFKVTADTLQPRPETETMLEVFENLALPVSATVADIGTGSGAIAVSVKLLHPGSTVCATEINQSALLVAKRNAENLGAQVEFYEGNLLEPIKDRRIDVILANLPYVPDGHTINQAAMQEPKIAIFGGPDGLELYRKMFAQIKTLPSSPIYVLTESLPFQHEILADIAASHNYKLVRTEDFIQTFTL